MSACTSPSARLLGPRMPAIVSYIHTNCNYPLRNVVLVAATAPQLCASKLDTHDEYAICMRPYLVAVSLVVVVVAFAWLG